MRKKSDCKLLTNQDQLQKKPKNLKTMSSNVDIYKDSDKISDIKTIIRKLEETILNNLNPDDYSLWLFDYIKEEEDTAQYEEDNISQSIESQIDRFYNDILADMSNSQNSIVGYIVIYSNCEELNKEDEFIGDFEICKNHSPNIFLNKNLKGFIVKKGHNALKFMTSYESLDQIILTKVNNKDVIGALKDFVNGREMFVMENIYKEVVI